MTRFIHSIILMLIGLISVECLYAQTLTLSKTIYLSSSDFKRGTDLKVAKDFINGEAGRKWTEVYPETDLYILQADRGVGKDDLLLVCTENEGKGQNLSFQGEGPFTDQVFSDLGILSLKPSSFIKNPEKFTKFKLIGTETIRSLPQVDLLGIHYILVRNDRTEEFEQFVKEELNPSLSGLLPDMGLFYYKAVDGEDTGSYITIFAISSVQARERFWPTGGGETEIIKDAFMPLGDLAEELEMYLVEGSYLLPESGGAAAIFESLKWTDFVILK